MAEKELLEVTITHNLPDAAEVNELFGRKLIALDWGRKGSNPSDYAGAGSLKDWQDGEVERRGRDGNAAGYTVVGELTDGLA